MAEHEFSKQARDYFRQRCQEDARERADMCFPMGHPEKEKWYEDAWRKCYAAHVGEDIPKKCPCCGR
jgi:hypothetical protein